MAAPKISPSAKPNTVSATSAMTSPPNLDHRSSGQPHEPHVGPTPSNPTPDPTPEPHDLLRIPDKKTIAKKAHLSAPSPLVLPRAVTAEAEIVSPISQTPSPPPSVLVAAAPPNHTSVFLAASKLRNASASAASKVPSNVSSSTAANLKPNSLDSVDATTITPLAIATKSDNMLEVEPASPAPTATLPNSPASTATISIATKLSMSTAPIEAPRRHSFPASSVEPVRP
ncbi:uncharacterized protein CcaverHIS019_0505180 [Cutaneotrichosporon cavernicola]|uniref:Uncharacterized protein n=1 Tax=Cutaneotrichosporon cavernicola TaxID=279322 RepID=A0AA48L6M1_9TREE|nr:uncharacterized protein CcaverHIS019_0505180 [Cutaneotrichosporon cavernicola]BEI92890.1 hypothetical protein CcaverHIS019_0505180 [Cutaneotrichosporon cavernicola]BEJ08432.1 hypothetical protein CcaverHIS641_0505170 [Cutaneotrichosporon cavernicola]